MFIQIMGMEIRIMMEKIHQSSGMEDIYKYIDMINDYEIGE